MIAPQPKVQLAEFKCKLPVEVIADILAYASAINSDKNYVALKAFEKLTSDKEFQQWKAENQDKVQSKLGPRSEPVSIAVKEVA
jgi:predicted kinase